jgi:hypothetical protein
MPQWEYLQVYAPHNEHSAHWLDSRGKSGQCAKMKIGGYGWTYNLAPFLNRLGAEGWELVTKEGNMLLLKRPKPAPPVDVPPPDQVGALGD